MTSNAKLLIAAAAALCAVPSAWAATPASGELKDDALVLDWTGGGPYVIPNLSSDAGEPVCDPPQLPLCDKVALTVNLSDEFRDLPENSRESVKFGIAFPTTVPADFDLFLNNAAGDLVAEATGSFGVQDAFSVPLKTLKNGSYTITVLPYTPSGNNYTGSAQVGKKKTGTTAFSIAPQAGSAPLTVTLDARALAGAAGSGYVFDFGDGSVPVADEDGVVQHTYERNGQFLARVRLADASGARAAPRAAAPVYVGEITSKAGKSGLGGAFGLLALLPLGLAALLRRRARA